MNSLATLLGFKVKSTRYLKRLDEAKNFLMSRF